MFRAIVLVWLAAMTPVAHSQQLEPPTAESVAAVYTSHGQPMDSRTSGRPVLLVLSAGCGHCVQLAAQYKAELIALMTQAEWRTRFIEMPRAIQLEPKSLYKPAAQAAQLASLAIECAQPKDSTETISMIADLGYAALHLVGGKPDPEHPLTSNWKDWVHLADVDADGQLQSSAVRVVQFVVKGRSIDATQCDQPTASQRIASRLKALSEARIRQVPMVYLLPDANHPEMEVWSYTRLRDALIAKAAAD